MSALSFFTAGWHQWPMQFNAGRSGGVQHTFIVLLRSASVVPSSKAVILCTIGRLSQLCVQFGFKFSNAIPRQVSCFVCMCTSTVFVVFLLRAAFLLVLLLMVWCGVVCIEDCYCRMSWSHLFYSFFIFILMGDYMGKQKRCWIQQLHIFGDAEPTNW